MKYDKLDVISYSELTKILKSMGFEMIRQKGSHQIYKHPDGRQTVIPFHKGEDIGKGLLKSILNDPVIPLSQQIMKFLVQS